MKQFRVAASQRCLATILASILATCLPASTSPQEAHISAAQFWDLYFRNQFLRLEQQNDVWRGEARAEVTQGHKPSALLSEVRSIPIEVTVEALRGYDYSIDARFARISTTPISVAAAFDAVIVKTYPYRDAAPFGKQRMVELFTLVRSRYRLPSGTALTLAKLEQILSAMISEHSEQLNQPIAALVWFLGDRRQRSSSSVLINVLRSSSYVRQSEPHIHFTAIDAAFSALWKVNDKTRLPDLLALMRDANPTGRQKIGSLFERLLSTDELLSPKRCGDAYLDPDFWARLIEPYRSYTHADWDRYDADSLFWELRYLAATRVSLKDSETLQKLANDEVAIVREAVAHRSSQGSRGQNQPN